ncbi:hypothetical protein HDE_09785 [Halotydeus destructor]|nr:hypothetical protein HDE_09785 [Halotydeus destructor]
MYVDEKNLGRKYTELKADIMKLYELNSFNGTIPYIACSNIDNVGPILDDLKIPWINMLKGECAIPSLVDLNRTMNVPFECQLHWFTSPTQKRFSGLLCAKRIAKQIYKFIDRSKLNNDDNENDVDIITK